MKSSSDASPECQFEALENIVECVGIEKDAHEPPLELTLRQGHSLTKRKALLEASKISCRHSLDRVEAK